MLEQIRAYSSRIKICGELPGMDPLLSSMRRDRSGGASLRQNMSTVAEIMGYEWRSGNYLNSGGTIVGIPRSGIPMGNGLRTVFPDYNYLYSNDGANREEGSPIFSEDLSINGSNLLIADSVIVTGTTVAQTLNAALSRSGSLDHMVVFTAFASVEGISNLLDAFPELEIVIGAIARTRQHWDGYRWKIKTILDGIPNFGELVSRP